VIDAEDVQRRARLKLRQIERQRNSRRYQRVLGRFVAEGVLTTNAEVSACRDPVAIEDVLWVGRIEPSFWELLPALVVRRPSMFESLAELPSDLAAVARRLRRNLEPPPFRGIPVNEFIAG
jgi:hypothetical protein